MIWVQYAIYGLGVGAVFALLGVGVVLVYRASGVLNFAHASMGVAAAYVNFELIERFDMPVGFALAFAVVFGALLGVVVHRAVFVPLANASQVVKLLASFGLAGVLQGLIGLLWTGWGTPSTFGHSLFAIDRGLHLGGAVVAWQRVALVVVGTVLSVGVALLLSRSEFGVQVRALAQNRMAARLAGIDDRRIEIQTWALAGATAAVAGVFVVPFGALSPLALSGFQLKALAAALVGGFASLPAVLAGGLSLGVVQELLVGAPPPLNGMRTVLASVLVLVLLLVRVERFFVSSLEARAVEGDERLAPVTGLPPALGTPRRWLIGFALVGVATLFLSDFWAFVATNTLVFAILGLSLVVLTGWSGQVSLMPGTFAGVGACLAWVLGTKLGYPFALAVPLAALGTVPVCALVGYAALRLRPLYLAIGTVAMAGLFEETLFRQEWFANGGRVMRVTRPDFVASDHTYALFVVAIAGSLFAATTALGRSRTGRALRMVRDNDMAATAGGANAVKYRLLAFALSAAYAGLAGALLAHLIGSFSTPAFSFLVLSLSAFGLAIVGGIRSPIGAAAGAFAFVYLTEVFRGRGTVSDWTSVLVGAGMIAVLAFSPDGLVGLAQRLVRRRSTTVESEPEPVTIDVIAEPELAR